jgi:hypothetical protein
MRHRGVGQPCRCRSRVAGDAGADERQIEIPQFYRKSEATLANVQRAREKPKRIRNIHAKIAGKLRPPGRRAVTGKGSASARRRWSLPNRGNVQSRRGLGVRQNSRDGLPLFAHLTVGRRP